MKGALLATITKGPGSLTKINQPRTHKGTTLRYLLSYARIKHFACFILSRISFALTS